MKTIKTINLFLASAFMLVSLHAAAQDNGRLVSENIHIKFFSTTPAEDIEANNYSATGTINTSDGSVAFSVPMQGFEFDKRLMQRHFNQEKFLHTSEYPTARLVGKITNIDEIDFSSNSTYDADIEGELTIRGVTNKINEKGTVTVNGNQVNAKSVFEVTLAGYGIEFVKGKPASNIAGTVEVTVNAKYNQQ
ncbi:MAG: YceI family protein [Bacteroidales bacterium]